MTENVETEVTLPVEIADTEMQLLDQFEIIRKRKRSIENQLADLKKVQYYSQESNRPPCGDYLSWAFMQWVYRKTYNGPVTESMIKAEGFWGLHLDTCTMRTIAESQRGFDEQRLESTQHIMTEEEILICF